MKFLSNLFGVGNVWKLGASAAGGVAARNAAQDQVRAYQRYGDEANSQAMHLAEQGRQALQPWSQRGGRASGELDGLLYGGEGSGLAADPFPVSAYGPTSGERPIYERPTAPTRPEHQRSSMAPMDLSLGMYQRSPAYESQLKQGLDSIMEQKALQGLTQSGAAMKSAMRYGQDLAAQDYYDWADRERGQWNADRADMNALFAEDRDYGARAFEADRAFANNAFEADRAFGTSVYDADRAHNADRYDRRVGYLTAQQGLGFDADGRLAALNKEYADLISGNKLAQAEGIGAAGLAASGKFNELLSSLWRD